MEVPSPSLSENEASTGHVQRPLKPALGMRGSNGSC